MTDLEKLVSYLEARGVLITPEIIQAFLKIDRVNFIRDNYFDEAYLDMPLPIGHNQTISQPTTVAMMFEWLQPQPGNRILDIGAGSGWTTALLAHLVGSEGKVIGLEYVSELVKFGQENLAKYNFPQARILPAQKTLGLPGQKFDRILVSAAASFFPNELKEQLEIGGIIVIPINSSIFVVKKISATEFTEEENYGFSFVPLIF